MCGEAAKVTRARNYLLGKFKSFLNAPCKNSIARVKAVGNQLKVTQLVQEPED